MPVPTLSLTDFTAGDAAAKARFSAALFKGFTDYGFVILKDHNVALDLLEPFASRAVRTDLDPRWQGGDQHPQLHLDRDIGPVGIDMPEPRGSAGGGGPGHLVAAAIPPDHGDRSGDALAGVDQQLDSLRVWHGVLKQLQPLCIQVGRDVGKTRNVPARPGKTLNQFCSDWIRHNQKN
jgi:hypothetical protein